MNKGNFINGSWIEDISLKTVYIKNPAELTKFIGQIQWADKTKTDYALDSAQKAFPLWRRTSIQERYQLIRDLLNEILINLEEIAQIITGENGKTILESITEVKAGVAESEFQMDYIKNHLIEVDNNTEIRYEAIGVFLAITPWNFPLATIMRKIVPALISGNTVIVKPSEHAPLTSVKLFELIDKVGFPAGVINLLNGDGFQIGSQLLESNYIKAISFTGSDYTGNLIAKNISGRDIRFQAEMGGSNAVVVMNDANLKIAIPDIISNAYACGGQWCTGTSRVVIEESIYDETLEKLKIASAQIVIGNGQDPKVTMGPLSNQRQFNDVKNKIKRAQKLGAKIELNGITDKVNTQNNYHIKPTIISQLSLTSELAKEEIFGPVLIVYKANNLQHAIDIVNNSPYGLSTSIYTENKEYSKQFIEEVESGLVHINLPTAHRQFDMPLMGWKDSGMGIPECGRFMLDLCTKPKVIYRK